MNALAQYRPAQSRLAFSGPAQSGPAESPIQVLADELPPNSTIQRIRGLLLAGYGKGASETTVMAVTRDRAAIGGVASETSREQLTQRTVASRGGPAGLLSGVLGALRKLIGAVVVPILILGVIGLIRRTK